MVRILVCIATLGWVTTVGAQTQQLDPISLASGWRFSFGDDVRWSEPEFDHASWQLISVGKAWEEQGFSDRDGFAWYRLQVRIPREYRDHPDLNKYGGLRLLLGKIDDVDQTWWNGHLVGATGSAMDPYSTKWNEQRSYAIPTHLVRWEATNVIAVRVYDGINEGGMYEGPYQLRIADWRDAARIQINLGRGDGIIQDMRETPIGATVVNSANEPLSGTVDWTIETDEGRQVATESRKLNIIAQGRQTVDCSYQPTEPGFYRVQCQFWQQSSDVQIAASSVLGYRPQEIKTQVTRATDFDHFWQHTLTELASVEPEFQLVAKPEYDTPTHQVFEVSMRSLGNVRVRGWYERPRAEGSFPALLRVPGYTMTMSPTRTGDPWAVFSFNIRAHGNSQQDVSGTPEDYWLRGLDDRQQYFYRGAYADCVRAVDFLASRKEVDINRIAVTGESQGGGLSLATAALDSRISLCAPSIPFLCNWHRYFKTSSWPDMDEWIAAESHRSWPATLHTMSYFDNLNFADRVKCPVFLGIGLQDQICPPATIFAVYNKLPGNKQYRIYPQAEHWVEASHAAEQRAWMEKHFDNKSHHE